MGRKNNKNKNKHRKEQIKQSLEQVQIKKEEKQPIVEVIEPIAEVKVQQAQIEVMKEEKRENMMKEPTEIIGKSSMIEEEIIGNPKPLVTEPVVEQIVKTQPVENPVVVKTEVLTQPVITPQNVVPMKPEVAIPTTIKAQPVIPTARPVQPQIVVEQSYQQPVYPQPQVVNQPVFTQPVKETVEQKPEKVDLLITKNPKSSFSEALKSVRTNLQFAAVEKEIKVVLVSSPELGDGKSLISSNLAGAYAQENKKVLIIDCDLRKGRQAEIFKIKKLPTTGYTNLILRYTQNGVNNFRVEDYICKTGISGIDLIPNGPTPPNPIELLSSSKNKELLDELKEKYDLIILDCPPVLGLSDALVMTKYSDANIVVISKGKTKIESLAEVKKSFAKVNSSITGVITNKAKRKHNSYYGYYGYYGE